MMLVITCCSCCRCCSCSSSSSNSCCSSSRLTTSLNISQSKTIFFDGTSDFEALALGRPGLDRLMSSTGQVGDSTSWRGGGLGGAQREIVHLPGGLRIVNHCFWYKHICGGSRRSKAPKLDFAGLTAPLRLKGHLFHSTGIINACIKTIMIVNENFKAWQSPPQRCSRCFPLLARPLAVALMGP